MELKETILSPVGKTRGGTHLPHHKNTSLCESVFLPTPDKVIIPMRQHIGAACEPVVKKGDKVYVGTLIGDIDRLVSAPVHSSVSGTVEKIDKILMPDGQYVDAVFIDSDGEMTPDPKLKAPVIKTKEDLIIATRDCGLVGLGGAGFPAHVKFRVKDDVHLDTLIVNGAECEPYITADERCCLEDYSDILEGVYLIKEMLGIERVIIAVENNKEEAIEKLYEVACDTRDTDDTVKVMRLTTRYPQGAEKVLIYSVLKRKVPAGKLPSDVGCVVMNVSSVAALYRYVRTGMPLVNRRLTVDGGAVTEPKNLIVPIGTKVSDILDFCGRNEDGPSRLLLGGPMMGTALPSDDFVITKTNNAILSLVEDEIPRPTGCIHCGRCAAHCPMKLNPSAVEQALTANSVDRIRSLYADYCMECGSCAYSCPARRPLAQIMRMAKKELRRNAK
ncbi:MAG: electron transport complex subunit RsxC [Acutalibacteraceae bacterium]|nr:electron transport complex subunit RsxC [Acutalibacteraceae bacterium]